MSKMTKCKVCGADVAKSATVCPNCGAKLKKRHPILGLILLIVGIGLIGGAMRGMGGTETTTPTDKLYAVGETAEQNGVAVTVKGYQELKNAAMPPTEGNVYVAVELEIENNSKNEIAVSSMISFSTYCDDYQTNLSIAAMAASPKNQLDGKVAPGKKFNGVVGYEIPADWKTLQIEYSPSFWSSALKFEVEHK